MQKKHTCISRTVSELIKLGKWGKTFCKVKQQTYHNVTRNIWMTLQIKNYFHEQTKNLRPQQLLLTTTTTIMETVQKRTQNHQTPTALCLNRTNMLDRFHVAGFRMLKSYQLGNRLHDSRAWRNHRNETNAYCNAIRNLFNYRTVANAQIRCELYVMSRCDIAWSTVSIVK
jgi:hypothetical protein